MGLLTFRADVDRYRLEIMHHGGDRGNHGPHLRQSVLNLQCDLFLTYIICLHSSDRQRQFDTSPATSHSSGLAAEQITNSVRCALPLSNRCFECARTAWILASTTDTLLWPPPCKTTAMNPNDHARMNSPCYPTNIQSGMLPALFQEAKGGYSMLANVTGELLSPPWNQCTDVIHWKAQLHRLLRSCTPYDSAHHSSPIMDPSHRQLSLHLQQSQDIQLNYPHRSCVVRTRALGFVTARAAHSLIEFLRLVISPYRYQHKFI